MELKNQDIVQIQIQALMKANIYIFKDLTNNKKVIIAVLYTSGSMCGNVCEKPQNKEM